MRKNNEEPGHPAAGEKNSQSHQRSCDSMIEEVWNKCVGKLINTVENDNENWKGSYSRESLAEIWGRCDMVTRSWLDM